MKILITENKLEKVLKQSGTEKIIQLVGGWENFCKLFNIESPMDFLHLFDDLEQVQSEEYENYTLFRYKKGNNYIIYDRKDEEVYISYYEIWLFLEDKFGLDDYEIKSLTEGWLDEVYNLRGVTTKWLPKIIEYMLVEVYNLK